MNEHLDMYQQSGNGGQFFGPQSPALMPNENLDMS
jgi:hypothetical protein